MGSEERVVPVDSVYLFIYSFSFFLSVEGAESHGHLTSPDGFIRSDFSPHFYPPPVSLCV